MATRNETESKDLFEQPGLIRPDWVEAYIEGGGKIEDESALINWCKEHCIHLSSVSPVETGYAATD